MSLQAIDPVTETAHDADQIVESARQRAIRVAAEGTPIGAEEFAAILRIGPSAFHRNAKRGLYDSFKLDPVLGPKCFSGVLVTRWLNGERLVEMSFGRKRVRHGK